MKYVYHTNGQVCARSIEIDVEDSVVRSVRFNGGCDGNHKGIESLVENMQVNEIIRRLSGITCGARTTSCPDQLAKALTEYQKKVENK